MAQNFNDLNITQQIIASDYMRQDLLVSSPEGTTREAIHEVMQRLNTIVSIQDSSFTFSSQEKEKVMAELLKR